MKKQLGLPLLLSLAAIFSHAGYSQTINNTDEAGPPIELGLTAFDSLESNSPLSAARDTSRASTSGALRAPAPSLSRVTVYAVGSSNCGWEYMTSVGQLSTTCDHGGAQLRVAVQEIGYGNNPVAWMNGGILPRSANYQTDGICIVGNQYTFPCPAGYTVVGWMHYYNLDGTDNGQFKFQDTSTNAPRNTLFTQTYIK
ncbi:YolA family protein [Dickeya dadantii subsp. dieffenbachiae]|uniref:YolA family protein n=1 Tax=Dickeya dadantii TaxID=204038 RepID=UPI0003A1B3A4|nr:YolA family protein [Dickeya dadantii]MCA7012277.1 YolA family protein [Dickeya dadantii]QWT40791.1 YolA family protein [Dickeya dadantii]